MVYAGYWLNFRVKLDLKKAGCEKLEAATEGISKAKCAHTEANVAAAVELTLSQEDRPQTHHSTRQLSKETCVI